MINMTSLWDSCDLDAEEAALIQIIKETLSDKIDGKAIECSDEKNLESDTAKSKSVENILFDSLVDAEANCKSLLEEANEVIVALSSLSSHYNEVSGRSNTLTKTCEQLLEQQHFLHQTVEVLQSSLVPFDHIEKSAVVLGLPVDLSAVDRVAGKGSSTNLAILPHSSSVDGNSKGSVGPSHGHGHGHVALDPRSPEFKDVLTQLTHGVEFLTTHTDMYDASKYFKYLLLLHHRSCSIITKNMKELLQSAGQLCRENYNSGTIGSVGGSSGRGANKAGQQREGAGGGLTKTRSGGNLAQGSGGGTGVSTVSSDVIVLESSYIYNKFKGLGFRMRELSALLAAFGANISTLVEAHNQMVANDGDGSSGGNKKMELHRSSSFNGMGSGGSISSGLTRANSGGNGGGGWFVDAVMGQLASSSNNSSGHGHGHGHGQQHASAILVNSDLFVDIKQYYIELRLELLKPVLHDMLYSSSVGGRGSSGAEAASGLSGPMSSSSLCFDVRYIFTTLLRISTLELQLFRVLFDSSNAVSRPGSPSPSAVSVPSSPSVAMMTKSAHHHANDISKDSEVCQIIELLCRYIEENIRPRIIREYSIDELCHIITILQHDLISQVHASCNSMSGNGSGSASGSGSSGGGSSGGGSDLSNSAAIAAQIQSLLLTSIHRIVNETQERLLFNVELEIRNKVQLFEPITSVHLNYPDCLVQTDANDTVVNSGTSDNVSDDVSAVPKPMDSAVGSMSLIVQSWYPTLRASLSLLSKLYGIIDSGVFEDVSRRIISLCVKSLKLGTEMIKKQSSIKLAPSHVHTQVGGGGSASNMSNKSNTNVSSTNYLSSSSLLNGDLFLIRHLLILREQLVAFDVKEWQQKERYLDFSTTSDAIMTFIARSWSRAPAAVMDPTSEGGNRSSDLSSRLETSSASGLYMLLTHASCPTMHENTVDIKKELDGMLKNSYNNLKQTIVKILLGPLEGFLIKVNAMLNTAPANIHATQDLLLTSTDPHSARVVLSLENRTLLSSQSFLKIDRMKTLLQSVLDNVSFYCVEIKNTLQLYITNSVARSILLKPIQTDISVINRKMDTIVYNCFALPKINGNSTTTNGTIIASSSSLALNADIQILTDLLSRINNVLNSELLNIKGK